MVDHDGAARGQRHGARVGRFDLVLDLKAREKRRFFTVALDAGDHVGHDVRHELTGLIVDVVRVDENFADVGLEVVADGADDEVAFLNDEEGRGIGAAQRTAVAHGLGRVVRHRTAVVVFGVFVLGNSRFADGAPELEQVVKVPLQLFDAAADAGGACDGAHARGQVELVHGFAQFLTFFAFDTARDAAAARVVGHQNEVTARKADEGRQGRTLVAALFLFNLNDEFLAFGERFADRGGAHVHAFLEVGAGDFLKGQEPVAFFAVVDETGFERGFDAGDDTLVNVGLALFAARHLDVDVDELLAFDDRHAGFFGVGRVK